MILSNKNDIEKDSIYSFLLCSLRSPKLEDVITIADEMLQLFKVGKKGKSFPSEYYLLKQVSSELDERKQCISKALNSIDFHDSLNCEEITIVDYGCGQGFASLSVLDWFVKNKGGLDNIKTVKLVDKNSKALSRALLHFSILFPSVEVVVYEQDLLKDDFSIECSSVLTINLFSHIIGDNLELMDLIKNLIYKGHNLLMYNIILEEIASKSFATKTPSHYLYYLVNKIKDITGCELCSEDEFTLKKRTSKNELIKLFKYIVISRIDVLKFNIPKTVNKFTHLFPGVPSKKLINVPQRVLWFERPICNTDYCCNLDDNNKISLEDNYVSPFFESKWNEQADILNPHTIKECAEMFHQSHIHHALSCGLECGQEIVSIYEKAANDGITEAYNNLGILQFYDSDKEGAEEKGIELFKMAAQGGSCRAMLNLASYYINNNNVQDAIEYYEKAAVEENAIACFNLAIIYNFGLYDQKIELSKAVKYYRKCLDYLKKETELDNNDYSLQNNCCLNLILLLNNQNKHYLKLLDIFYCALKPSDSLKYCFEILQIKHTNRFSKDIMKTLSLSGSEKEKDFMKYNRAIFLYSGLNIKPFNIKIERDYDSAIDIMRQLVESDCSDWEEREKYVYPLYAYWLYSCNKRQGGQDEVYWRKAALANTDNACAYLTNIASSCGLEDEENKKIWGKYAFSDGCKSCHECTNYNNILRCCPKAQLKWANYYEKNSVIADKLIIRSAEQKYVRALFHLGFRKAIKENIPSFKENYSFNRTTNYTLALPPDEYKVLFPILAKDRYFYFLQEAADLRDYHSQSLMPYIAKLRSDKFNYIYWAVVFNSRFYEEDLKRSMLEFFEEKTNKSINNFFEPKTVCEKQLLSIACDIANHTKDTNFICLIANYYLQGNCLYDARKYYNIAKDKGCNEIDDILNDINTRINDLEEARSNSYDYDDYYDPYENYTREDSLMDALDGEMDAYWNID